MKPVARRYTLALTLLLLAGIAVVPPDRGPFVAAGYEAWQEVAIPAEAPAHHVLLLGDTGVPRRDPLEPTLRLLQRQMLAAGGNATAVFLGDNVYPRGIPAPDAPGAEEATLRLTTQLDALRGLPGRALFVPGNHDWNEGEPDGEQFVARQEAMVVGALGDHAYPVPAGQPGPTAVRLAPGLTLIALDTAWFLYEPGDERPGRDEAEAAFARALADTLAAYAGDRLVVVGHHPLYSNGQHSGRYPFRSHVFPLIELRPWAFVPLPVLGTLAFAYVERYGLTAQDLGHWRYRALRHTLVSAFAPYDGLIYAAGHEHNLQYFPVQSAEAAQHAIVSGAGAGAKTEELVAGHGLAYGYASEGLAHLRFYTDGSVFLDFVIPKNGGNDSEVVFRARLQ